MNSIKQCIQTFKIVLNSFVVKQALTQLEYNSDLVLIGELGIL